MSEKEFKKFDKTLSNILSSSAGAASWSDLLSFTKEMFRQLEDKKDKFNFGILTDKISLSKRLAQCLNPECPGGVHEVVINIYDILFQNILAKNNGKLGDNLGIYSSGLFPFFSYASKANKILILEKIIKSCFMKLEQNELNLCLSGLLSSLIPGLDDNNEETTQKIYSTFDELKKKMKPGVFYGTFWSILLRNRLLRASGIKYLCERIIKYINYKELSEEEKKEKIEDEFPNANSLLINSLSELIEEQDVVTVRNSMDFIITRLPLSKENTIISDESKIILMKSALKLLIKNDYSTTRRLSNWILGTNSQDDEINLESEDTNYKLELMVTALKSMINSKEAINSENLKNYIRIIDQLFIQQVDFVDFILPKISYDLILCFVEFWQKELNSSENAINNETIKRLSNFFKKEENYINLWKSIAKYLDTVQDRDDLNYETDDYNSVVYIEKFIYQTIQVLKFCTLFIDLQSGPERIKYYIPIINNLIKIINKLVIKNRENLTKIRHIIVTTLVFTRKLQEMGLKNIQDINIIKEEKPKTDNNQENNINNNNTKRKSSLFVLYNEENENDKEAKEKYIITEEASLKHILEDKNNIEIMDAFNETITNYQKFYIKLLEIFYSIPNNSQVTKMEISYFQKTTELMIRLQEYIKSTDIPEWYFFLEKIIFKVDGNFRLSLEASKCLLDFNLSSFNDNEIYTKIKNNFGKDDIDNSIINEEEYNNKFNKIGINKTCYELLLGKLYNKVNEQINQETIINLLVKILKLDEERFLRVLENSFKVKDYMEDNVKLFSDFWQFLNEYYNDLLIFKNGECVFQMIDFLDSENPLLRHLAKSWLDQSSKQYKKMVDPILKILLDDNIQITKGENLYEIAKEYDTKKLMDSFRRLKNLIINSPVIKFFIENKPNDDIIEIFKNKKIYMLSKPEINYFYMLTSISLIFTQGQCSPNLSEQFKKENFSINASSCEFLEFLLSHVNNPDIIMSYAKNINIPILFLLDKALDDKNKNNVMQVQLLSVLRVLYFKTSSVHLKYKADTLSLFSNQDLINCLSKGMTRDYYFVRENYINFTRECLPLFKRIMMDDEEAKKTYYRWGGTFILALAVNLSRKITINTRGRKDTERFSHFDEKNNSNYFIYKNYLDEYKEYKLFDEGDALLILKGIKDIIFFFLNIKPKNSDSIIWPEFKNTLIESQKVPSGFFGLFSDNDKPKNALDENIKELFSSQIMDLMNCLLLTWINSSEKYEPYDFCLNFNGILPLKTANKEIFSDDDIKQGLNSIKKDTMKNIVREISFNLFLVSPIEFFQTIIKIWCYSSTKKPKNIDISIDPQYKLTIIELLISLNIPLNIILYCMNTILIKNAAIEKLKEKNEKKPPKYVKDPKSKVFILPTNIGIFEAKILHFIYSYILLNPFKDVKAFLYNNDQTRNEINESYREMILFLNTIISDTKIIYTFCWIYELLQLSLEKIKIVKYVDSNTKYKLLDLFNTVTEKLENCAFYNKTESKNIREGILILPYLPHVYLNIIKEIYPEYLLYIYNRNESGQNQNIKDDKNNAILKANLTLREFNYDKINRKNAKSIINSEVKDFYTKYYAQAKLCTERLELSSAPPLKPDILESIYRQLACITLKDNFFKISINIYDDQNSFKKKLTDIIKKLIELLRYSNNPQDQKDNNNIDKDFYSEFSSEFLASLITDSPMNVTACGKYMFMDYLKEPYFFMTKPKTLRNFRKFISILVLNYPEILSELIRNINSGFFLFGGSDEDKIKTLRRISFVIYSCDKDKFRNDFDNIKDKAKLFLTSYKDNSRLEQEIFLMMRILFLRFSHEGVMKMIKDLWPIIFSELIENFKNENRNKNINLIIESFKFIELLSLANTAEFSLYQWIFLLDTFNMKDLDTKDKESLLSDLLKKESKIFKPVALDILTKGDMDIDEDMMEGKHEGKSTLIFCPEKPTLTELQNSVKKFFFSIGDMNNYKVEMDSDQIEKLIEEDFIDYKSDKKSK